MADPLHVFNPTFRSWATYLDDDLETPRLIVKTGFLVDLGPEQWPTHLHNFWVYNGRHELLGTLEPLRPESEKMRRFKFHRHADLQYVELPGAYWDMEGVIEELMRNPLS